jgi:uncharacterized glyoxalase superfamily protein PhnB
MTRFKRFVPVLRVTDMQQAIDFYVRHFGAALCWRSPADGGGENCMLELGDLALMFSTGSHLGDVPHFTGTLYIDMDGVEALYEKLKGQVTVVWPLEVMDYGQKEFGIKDCNGYTLAFAEAISP